MATGRLQTERLIRFDGTVSEYAKFLETTVVNLRKQVQDLSAQIAQRPSSCNSPTLIIEIENPETQNRSREPQDNIVASFLGNLPTSIDGWSAKASDALLATPTQLVQAYELLTLQSRPTSSPRSHVTVPDTPEALVECYQQLICSLQRSAMHWTQVHAYSDLIWHCICQVARYHGISVDAADRLAAHLTKNRGTSRYNSRLRHAAKLVAGIIDELETDLGYLGSHMFLLCMSSIISHLEIITNNV